ncbi:hypothetical protein DBR42_11155, partial [Pelomonas sp. HMWF004]
MNDPTRNRPYVDPTSLAADALHKQAASSAAEPPAWQKAAVRQRQAAPVPRHVAPPPPPKGSYLASHWRGEQSLVRSYWVNNV